MTLHIHRYIELSAPLEHVYTMLVVQPPLDAEPLGQFWRWQNELWSIRTQTFEDGRIVWQGTCPALPDALIYIAVTLHDATIATQVQLHLAVDLPTTGRGGPTSRRLHYAIEADLDRALTRLHSQTHQAHGASLATSSNADAAALLEQLQTTHPATFMAFTAMKALPSLVAVAQLDARWQATAAGQVPTELYHQVAELPVSSAAYDLIYAGGGLGLLHAAVMVHRYGYQVLLFDRGEVGCAHREWNISDHELRALVQIGLFTYDELESVVMRRYHDGIVRFWPGGSGVQPAELHLPDVLNVALDATALLQLTRQKLEAAGGIVLDHRTFKSVYVTEPGRVVVEVLDDDSNIERYAGRVLLDGMGSTSPLALQRFAGQPFAGVCPTVGTVVKGLEPGLAPDQHNPDVGDVLISVTDAQRGRQLIWEGFAGRDDELTVYVFYYDLLRQPTAKHSLLDLFEDYFRLLPTYKRPGPDFRHVKPVYGFIPARHTQRRLSVPLLNGVLPIGDSAAQQSPLTFCGFGSHVRNLHRTTQLLDYALRRKLLAPAQLGHISAYQSNVALNWVFSRFMQPWDQPHDVNRLQNIFARVLNEVGIDTAVRFFQDQMTWRDYGRIVNHTLTIYKAIIPTTLRVLGPRDTLRWIVDWLRFCGAAAFATVGRTVGNTTLDTVESWLDHRQATWALWLKARRAEWNAMGWQAKK